MSFQNISGHEKDLLVAKNEENVATFVSKCLTCQQVKFEYQRPVGQLQTLEITVEEGELNS